MFGVQRNWHVRAIAIGGVVLIHAILLVTIAQRRAERNTEGGSRELFRPVISHIGETRLGGLRRTADGSPEAQAEPQAAPENRAIPNGRWRFDPVEIWPSRVLPSELTIELSSFTGRPATPLQPIDPAPGSKPRPIPASATLRMLRWVRPEYLPSSAEAGEQGTAQLELHVDDVGRPIEIHLTRSTGFADLDQAALQAARAWTFSPPMNESQPVSTWAEIEIRFEAR